MEKGGWVDIMANRYRGGMYVGVSSDLIRRVWQHREGVIEGFTKETDCKILVWFQAFDDLQEARLRELQMKEWKRLWKLRVIEEMNPEWDDLFESLF